MLLAVPAVCRGQSALTLQQAVDEALQTRMSLKAAAERVGVAEGARQQAAALPNPDVQFQSENLRPGQTFSRDVDTLAVLTERLDVLGKRTGRIEVANRGVDRARIEYEAERQNVVRDVTIAYWNAAEAQEVRRVLSSTLDNYQQILSFHEAQLRVGVIAEQDVLRIRLERERLAIASGLAELEASRTQLALFREIGRVTASDVSLADPLDAIAEVRTAVDNDQVLTRRVEGRLATAAVAQAEASARLQRLQGRPDLDGVFGFKRTLLPDRDRGANTLVAGFRITLPVVDRNTGNRAAAAAELRRQQALQAATDAALRNEYQTARQEYLLRRRQITTVVQPLEQHADEIATIAQAAYEQGGTDLLRLLDAQRARLDAELASVHALADYQRSAANLAFAEGAVR